MITKTKYIIFSYTLLFSIGFACPPDTNCFIPEAHAGDDKTYYINSTVILDGSNSSDPEGMELSYTWTSDFGAEIPTCEEYVNSLENSDTMTSDGLIQDCEDLGGVLEFTEMICLDIYGYEDDNLQSDCEANGFVTAIYNSCISSQYSDYYPCDEMLQDPPPSSAECSLLTDVFKVNICDLAGSALLESFGGINLEGPNPSFDLGVSEEVVTISLIVNDGDYNSIPDEVNITVVGSNSPPVINVETALTVNKNSEFIIDASATQDDGSLTGIMNFSWNTGSLICSGDSTPVLTCTSPEVQLDDNFTITLTVSDEADENSSSSEDILITVIANQKPVSIPSVVNQDDGSLTGLDQEVGLGTSITLDGSLSYDPEGASLTYLWTLPDDFSFVEGYTANEKIVEVSYNGLTIPAENEHIFSLVVNDGSDDSEVSLGEDIFISEYCDHPDDSDVRYFEIYNPTNDAINLEDYEIWYISGAGDWPESTLNLDGSIGAGKAIVISRKDENTDAGDYIDFANIQSIIWSTFNTTGDDAVGIAKNGILIDAVGGGSDPGSGWEVAGYDDATKDGQIIRKNTVVKGNINSDCMVIPNENESCWDISRGTNQQDSEWIYYEDSDEGNTDIPDVDSFANAGKHYCATCNNSLIVTLTENNAPIAAINSDFNLVGQVYVSPWEAVIGSTIILDATNSSDPEGASLNYTWSSDDLLIEDEDSSSSMLSIIIPNDNLEQISIQLVVSDGTSDDTINIQVNIASANENPNPVVTFVSMTDKESIIVEPPGSGIFFEGHTVTFSASDSFDPTFTGSLDYSWVLTPADIEITNSSSSTIAIVMPEFISVDKDYSLVLTASDGTDSADFEYLFTVDARMPIIGVVASEIEGFEGEYVKVDASSTTNPGGDVEELVYEWGPNNLISGYCDTNVEISCDDLACDGICMDDKSTAFVLIDKSIGVNTTYDITVTAENSEELESADTSINVNVIAQYPVSNAGLDRTYTSGTTVILNGHRSYDPQEESVSFSYWDLQSDGTSDWESGNEVKVIAFYNEVDGLTPKDGYLFTWTAPDGINLSDVNAVSPTFIAPDVEGPLEFELIITDESSGYISLPTTVEIEIVNNDDPVAVIGGYRIYNEGELEERYLYGNSSLTSDPDTLRLLIGTEYQLYGENSYDETPFGSLTYNWTSLNNIVISDVNSPNITFTVPTDLCDDGYSLDKISCCNNNGGSWSAAQVCEGENSLWKNQSEPILFQLEVTDLDGLSATTSIPVVYSAYSAPIQPTLYATRDHEVINLFWDTKAPNSIDDLTGYADFQGYKIYRSTDYGETWGDAIYDDGNLVGWKPYVQYDLSAAQDSTYCLYKNDFIGCGENDKGLDVAAGVDVNRYDEISGSVDWYEGYFWQELGSNTGLSQTFVDEDVIDGVDYTYTITSYDSGVRPDTLQYGHFGELSGSTWDPDVWIKDEPIYTFREVVEADSFYFFQMDQNILESYIDEGKHMYRLEIPVDWNVGGGVDEIISSEEVSEGVKIWDTNTVWPISNPDEFSAMYSLETVFGTSTDDQNFVTISPGFYASNVSFPEIEDLDTFIAADCEAIGDGNRFYEIVNEADLSSGYVKLEIQANSGSNIFENYVTEDACLYAYKVQKIVSANSPVEYIPYETPDGENGPGYLEKYELQEDGLSFLDNSDQIQSIDSILDLPGVSMDEEYIYIPNYLIECHQLSYLDDPGFDSNWTEFFDGIRMRFDNSLREEPDDKSAALKEVYSYPDSSLAELLYADQSSFYGNISLKYFTGAFSKKPSYEYEIELNNDFIDEAVFSTTDISGGPQEKCGRSFSTSLPFKIKNLTTGKYVRVSHTDFGIWNNVATDIPSWFSTPNDPTTHPGYGDCVWSPGEWISFYYDDVIVGDSQQETPTFNLELSFNALTVFNYENEKCPLIVDYDETTTYPSGSCINHAGNVWYATVDIKPSDIVVESDINEISVVPNPYIISSRFNEGTNGSRIRFTHLPQQCTVSIFTISGELVKIIDHDDNFDSNVFWDLKNSKNKK
ncbi:lamin tail domain-containing protein, partial [Candidatus Marinimicrobia bacterium]|nr:lamin tail domain-containing protein [Candidatus Neomarinimicrobiota bacterium]